MNNEKKFQESIYESLKGFAEELQKEVDGQQKIAKNEKLNNQMIEFLRLNKILQSETFLIVEKLNRPGALTPDNSLMFKGYTDMVTRLRDDLVTITWEIRNTLHNTNEKR